MRDWPLFAAALLVVQGTSGQSGLLPAGIDAFLTGRTSSGSRRSTNGRRPPSWSPRWPGETPHYCLRIIAGLQGKKFTAPPLPPLERLDPAVREYLKRWQQPGGWTAGRGAGGGCPSARLLVCAIAGTDPACFRPRGGGQDHRDFGFGAGAPRLSNHPTIFPAAC